MSLIHGIYNNSKHRLLLLVTGSLLLISHGIAQAATEIVSTGIANSSFGFSCISGDGNVVGFISPTPSLTSPTADELHVRNRQTNTTMLVASGDIDPGGNTFETGAPSSACSLSDDGQRIVYARTQSNRINVFVHILNTSNTFMVNTTNNPSGAINSPQPVISGDGNTVAFVIGDAVARTRQVFVRELNAATGQPIGTPILISARDNTGEGSGNPAQQGSSNSGFAFGILSETATSIGISRDGRFVVFSSMAINLIDSDSNDTESDIFLRDRSNGRTTLISMSTNGTQANLASDMPVISADGNYIAFRSAANNLVSGDTNNASDIFLHIIDTEQTIRVNVTNSGAQATVGNIPVQREALIGTDPSVAITDDGQILVTFTSVATNLTGDTNNNGRSHVMLRDVTNNTTTRLTPIPSGSTFANSDQSALSANGLVVAFRSNLNNLVSGDIDALQDVFVRFPVIDPTILLDNFDND